MEQYINKKNALVKEIEELRDRIKKGIFSIPLTGRDRAYATQEYEILGKIRDFLYILDTKEVDLVGQLNGFQNFYAHENGGEFPSAIEIAEHFFELGLKAQKGE